VSKEVPRAGRGRTAAVSDGFYEPPPVVELPEDGGAPVVRFTGEDGRERVFRFEGLPLPGLHRDFAHALGVRIGPGGGRRTQRAASSQWQTVKRFLLLLDQLAEPPCRVQKLRVRHLERYLMSRWQTCGEKSARRNLQDLLRIVRVLPGQDRLDGAVADYAVQPGHGVAAQQEADADHPWQGRHSSVGWGTRGELEYHPVRLDLVAEFQADNAVDEGRYRHPVRFLRLREDLTPGDVPPFDN
jgi:hypothetical protein